MPFGARLSTTAAASSAASRRLPVKMCAPSAMKVYSTGMSLSTTNTAARKTFAAGYVFGAPVQELGLIASLIMGLATGFIGFFAATFVGIVVVMVLNGAGHPADYTMSY